MYITGRYKIEIVPKLFLQKRHTQLYLLKPEDNILHILNTFYKESLHPSNYDYINCGQVIYDIWSIQNLQRFLKSHNQVELNLLYRQSHQVKIAPHSHKNPFTNYKRDCTYPGDYKQDICEDVVGISLVYLKDKRDVRGIKKKLKRIASGLSLK